MRWKLRDGIVHHEMHPAGRLHLFHGIVPVSAGLIHLLGGGILHVRRRVPAPLVADLRPLDAILISGDLTDAGVSAEWAELFDALALYPKLAGLMIGKPLARRPPAERFDRLCPGRRILGRQFVLGRSRLKIFRAEAAPDPAAAPCVPSASLEPAVSRWPA